MKTQFLKKTNCSLLLQSVLLATLLAASGIAAADTHWGYSGDTGPEYWAKLTPEFGACAGSSQSPINLEKFTEAELPPLSFDYSTTGTEIFNNGHTVQITYQPGSTITIDDMPFEMKQLHFHAPSENLIQGRSYPLEAHLVHVNAQGEYAVVALMFEEGTDNPALAAAWSQLPETEGARSELTTPFAAQALLPENKEYFRFAGSLTTPPCTEGVRWIVLKHPVTASREQIEAFQTVMHHPNNRPTQPVNGREIFN